MTHQAVNQSSSENIANQLIGSYGENNPVYFRQQETNVNVTPSLTADQGVSSLGQNNPIYYGAQPMEVQYRSITSGNEVASSFGANNPVMVARAQNEYQNMYLSGFANLPAEVEAELVANEAYLISAGNTVANRPSSQNMGARILADIIPTAGATETFTPDVGDHFFDPGGPGGSSTGGTAGNYPNCGCVTTTTLDGVTEIDFLFFSVFATFDWLKIYDSADTSGPVLFDNGSGGANEGDITLADMIASHGSSSFVGTSGAITFEFNATTVVDYGGWDVEIIAAGGGGGGGGAPCATTGPGNAFENGKSFTNNLGRIVAHDVTVDADGDFMLEMVNLNAFIGASGSGVNAAFVDFYVYEDAGGSPGTVLTSELGMVPASQTVVGSNFGFDVWDVELDVTDINLPGQAGTTTTYWIGVSLEPTDASNTFWENSTAGLVGLGEAYDDGLGGGFVLDNTLEGVYTIAGTCTGGGGGGSTPCSTDGLGNAFENGKSFTNNLGRIVAHDVTVDADGE
jgi:hypothetical protein